MPSVQWRNTLALALLAVLPLSPQQPEEPTLRITVTLVQVDAVVTDSKGRHVPDLKPEDFELRQDGKLQKIVSLSYISGEPGAINRPAPAPRNSNDPPLPPVALKLNQVKRTMALVVDDLGLSFESTAQVRSALKKFVDEQMREGDLVAILKTGAGMGALQQFTSDKRVLYAAIERINWNFRSRTGLNSFAPINDDATPEEAAAETKETEFRQDYFSVGTLGAIQYVVQGLRELPGRKSVVVLSENLPIFQSDGMNPRIMAAMEKLTDAANRAAVVLYTIDPRGLPTLSMSAADRVRPQSGPDAPDRAAERRQQYYESQNGLNYLAQETGGIFFRDTNDIAGSLRQVAEDQSGYYLIAYSPQEGTFDKDLKNQKFHRISVKVLRPGLQVRSRSGFLGVPDTKLTSAPRSRDAQIAAALTSPFGASGIRLHLTSLFNHDAKMGPYVQSLLHIEAKDLKFAEEAEGWHKANLTVITMAFGDNGQADDRTAKTYTLRLRGPTYQEALKRGFVYNVVHPLKKAGAFQFRAVVQDSGSQQIGSASQFIEIPDLKRGRLALSGLVIKAASNELRQQQGLIVRKEEQDTGETSEGSAAVRRFRIGQSVTYACRIFNARIDSKTQQHGVESQLRLYRNGQIIFEGKPSAVSPPAPEAKELIAAGILRLGGQLTPGSYVLQIIATDKMAKEKFRRASQSMDFEVVAAEQAANSPENRP